MPNHYRVENQNHAADDLAGAPTADVINTHRQRIEPWLSAIFQSEHLNLLLGSGFSVGLAQAAEAPSASMAAVEIDPAFDVSIRAAAERSSTAMGRGPANIEDQLRTALALAEGLKIQGDGRQPAFVTNLNRVLANFANSIVQMEAAMIAGEVIEAVAHARFEKVLKGFLMSFASRTSSRDRLHVFTTNYDRVIEHSFDLLGIHTLDRFVGALSPRFRASRFDIDATYAPSGNRSDMRPLEGVVRLTKLHGSIDWMSKGREITRQPLPFGSPLRLDAAQAQDLMIFPNSAKDIETAFYPYAELFRDFSAAICRPNSALVTYGYGFGDDHVNRIIRDMLTQPSTHLVVISFDDAGDRIRRFVDQTGCASQVSLIVGPDLAGLEKLIDNYLPKPAIDTITQRQAELLGRRGPREAGERTA